MATLTDAQKKKIVTIEGLAEFKTNLVNEVNKIKDVDTVLTETTVSDNVPTSSAVVTFVNGQIEIITDALGNIGNLLDFINGEVV